MLNAGHRSRIAGVAGAREESSWCDLPLREKEGKCAGCCLWRSWPGAWSEPAERRRTPRGIVNEALPAGACLYREGEPGTRVYSLRSGLVKLFQRLPNGTERIVRLLGKGDLAGLEILGRRTYRHTAITLEPADACRIPRSVLAESLSVNPRLLGELMERLQRSLETADWWTSQLSTGPVSARMARLILLLKRVEAPGPGSRVKLPHRDDMAAMLGVATETLCRAMAECQRQAVLRRIDKSHFEFDAAALERLALG